MPPGILLLLSNLYGMMGQPKPTAAAPKKLLFYIASMRQLSRADWLQIEGELNKEIQLLQPDHEEGSPEDRPALKVS